ncbi:unnamed protein product, partial [Medioppia subpectinata]
AAAATAAQHSAKKSKSGAKKSKNKGSVDVNDENTKRFVERLGREDSQSCGCDDCVKYASDRQTADDMAVKLVADEEKKKKKSEKKKLQKKKKRDKKKAEKETAKDSTATSSAANHSKTDCQKNVNNNNTNNNNNNTKNSNSNQNISNNLNNNNNNTRNNSKMLDTNAAKGTKNEQKNEPKNAQKKVAKNAAKNSTETKNNIKQQNGAKSGDNHSSNKSSPKSADKEGEHHSGGSGSGAEEDELSFNSAFVAQIAQRKSKPAAGPPLTKDQKAKNIEESISLAIQANQKAENNKFTEAIDLFSQALAYNVNDYRFYVNRSYCYDSIQDFRSALRDAETAIQLRPDWPKCHYRRGKALAGLKNYHEAEIALKKVLTLEADCDEALSELWHVRYGAIVDTGYDTADANLYSSQYDSIDEALKALSLKSNEQKQHNYSRIATKNTDNMNGNPFGGGFGGGVRKSNSFSDDDIYVSDDEYNAVAREPTFEETSPTNPFGWKALWVGNVAAEAKLDTVTALFRKFGQLNYCNIFKGTNGGSFILAHYDNSESPRKAMTKYQGKVIPGISIKEMPLTIRFRPNKDQKKPNYDHRLESDECYYWRTTGCARGDKCLYKHIQANRGVDKQAWMCNPLKKGLQPFQKPK